MNSEPQNDVRALIAQFQLPEEAAPVLSLALQIHDDPLRVIDWYRHVPIVELRSMTADRLVLKGQANVVVQYLQSIAAGSSG